MAKDLRGLFQNNRRREAHAVTVAVPALIESADLREGTPDVLLANGAYTVADIPAGVIITRACVVVDDKMDAATTVKFDLSGGTALVPATAGNALGLTDGALTPLLITAPEQVVATVGAAGAKVGSVKLVLEYIDYERATMSYLGES